jgi:hypothetical protein
MNFIPEYATSDADNAGERSRFMKKDTRGQSVLWTRAEENSMGIAYSRTWVALPLDTTLSHDVSRRLHDLRLQRIRFDVVSRFRFYAGLIRRDVAAVPGQPQFRLLGSNRSAASLAGV